MHRFTTMPHMADVAVKAVGSTQAELLQALVQGMFAAAEPVFEEPAQQRKRTFDVYSADFSSLLVDVLNEATTKSDTYDEAYTTIKFEKVTNAHARGMFVGKAVQAFGTQIKAATHHDLVVKQQKGRFEATIVFDA